MSDDNDHDHDDEFEPPPEEYQEYLRKISVRKPSTSTNEEPEDIPEVVDALKLITTSKPNSKTDGMNKSRKTIKGARKKSPNVKSQSLPKSPSRATRKSARRVKENSSDNVKKAAIGKDSKEAIAKQSEKSSPAPPTPTHTISRAESPKPSQKPLQKPIVPDEVDSELSPSPKEKEKKTSISTRSGKYLRSRIGPRPTILTAVPHLAPLKSGTAEEIQLIMSNYTPPASINANDSIGFISSISSKNRSTQDEVAILSANKSKCQSPGSPSTVPIEELFVDVISDTDGNISDINSAISLMVKGLI
ncbi:unnamed protein product [Allacma fusca]|uniref:Uncharacterized protein n=1 Tax=Allacma fusca TaxID=39272 RepID=A0A8J2M408_9HEXA|nr:unnamed protein product [Allacma fusca]